MGNVFSALLDTVFECSDKVFVFLFLFFVIAITRSNVHSKASGRIEPPTAAMLAISIVLKPFLVLSLAVVGVVNGKCDGMGVFSGGVCVLKGCVGMLSGDSSVHRGDVGMLNIGVGMLSVGVLSMLNGEPGVSVVIVLKVDA